MMRPNPKLMTYLPQVDEFSGGAGAEPPPAKQPDPIAQQPDSGLSPWLQYLYFLRAPILGWIALPVFCLIDGCSGISALTRGIATMSGGWQMFHATFFSIGLLMAVLVCAKNIVINGNARFKSPPPTSLLRVLESDRPLTMWTVLAVAQLPALGTIVYVSYRTVEEQTGWAKDLPDPRSLLRTVWPYGGWHASLFLWLAAGLAAAGLFWCLVSIFYYWTYPAPVPPDSAASATKQLPSRAAVPLIFPVRREFTPGQIKASEAAGQQSKPSRSLITRAKLSEKPLFAEWIEAAAKRLLRISHTGYADSADEPLYELHFLSIVSLSAILLLYLFLYPLIAPVVVSRGFSADPFLAILLFLGAGVGALTYRSHRMQFTGLLFTLILLAGLIAFFAFYFTNSFTGRVQLETSFPTLGAVLVILIFFQWLFSGATFFLDRHRVPVLSALLVIIFLPKAIPWIDGEHYFNAVPTQALEPSQVDIPTQALDHRLGRVAPGEPLVIVTAMGGGIQAAEWTAQVMARLESTLRDDKDLHYKLHDHLLLASGVSGGSVGLMPYLLEYTAAQPAQFSTARAADGRDLLTARLTTGPACSGLEAVAWGLEYYDLQRLWLTVRLPWIQSLTKAAYSQVAPDRTWALTEALNRNLNDKDCSTNNFAPLPPVRDGVQATLTWAAGALQRGAMPAFTFNTTVAETGDRFLLSNYNVPPNGASAALPEPLLRLGSDSLPAESFLQAYTQVDRGRQTDGGYGVYADLSLATAARLSATFPVVSSATRIPKQFAPVASHFVDGGYFDNDGTASATEFLASAMKDRPAGRPPLKILLVEIRDGTDLNSAENDDDLAHQTGQDDSGRVGDAPKPWSTFGQIGAPLSGMWNAGHKSTTRRNRNELCLLEKAYSPQQLQVHHVVFGIPNQTERPASKDKHAKYKASPLSWKLTEGQKEYIRRWIDSDATRDSVADVKQWLRSSATNSTNEACLVHDQVIP